MKPSERIEEIADEMGFRLFDPSYFEQSMVAIVNYLDEEWAKKRALLPKLTSKEVSDYKKFLGEENFKIAYPDYEVEDEKA